MLEKFAKGAEGSLSKFLFMNFARTLLGYRTEEYFFLFDVSGKEYKRKCKLKLESELGDVRDMGINWRKRKVLFLTEKGWIYSKGLLTKEFDTKFSLSSACSKSPKISLPPRKELYKSLCISKCDGFIAVSSTIEEQGSKAPDRIYYLTEVIIERRDGSEESGFTAFDCYEVYKPEWKGEKDFIFALDFSVTINKEPILTAVTSCTGTLYIFVIQNDTIKPLIKEEKIHDRKKNFNLDLVNGFVEKDGDYWSCSCDDFVNKLSLQQGK